MFWVKKNTNFLVEICCTIFEKMLNRCMEFSCFLFSAQVRLENFRKVPRENAQLKIFKIRMWTLRQRISVYPENLHYYILQTLPPPPPPPKSHTGGLKLYSCSNQHFLNK
jgi:hypothetical protein